MTIRHDTEDALEKYEITKIDGQPTEEDLNLLVKELSNALGSIATTNGGREHGYVGLIVEEAEYITFSNGNERFVVPTNPGAYPATVDADAVICEQQIAEHKAKIVEYKRSSGSRTSVEGKLLSLSITNGSRRLKAKRWVSTTSPQKN